MTPAAKAYYCFIVINLRIFLLFKYFWFVCSAVAKDCADTFKVGERDSGVYTINYSDGSGVFDVFCDQTTTGGGWLEFQKRLDGSVDFHRGWYDYKHGFGNLSGEFWLGLDNIHRLTTSGSYKLRIDLEDVAGNTHYAEYDPFWVSSEGAQYRLSVGSHTGLISLRSLISIDKFYIR